MFGERTHKRGLPLAVAAMCFGSIIGAEPASVEARRKWELHYRWAIITQGAGGIPLVTFGYAPTVPGATGEETVITSLNQAVNEGMAMLRRFQSSGKDCRLEVFGKPVDDTDANRGHVAAPANPLRALTAGEQDEQVFARIDTPELGLRDALRYANKSGGSSVTLRGDTAEDAEDVSA